MTPPTMQALLGQSGDARRRGWSAWGEVDPEVLTHLINPSLTGGPRWPAMRQAFCVARRPDATLVASDGLSDPFDGGQRAGNGFGLEVFALSSDPVDPIPGSYLWDLVWQMSQQVAQHGGVAQLLDQLGLLSAELYDVRIPPEHAARFVNPEGRVGVLVGLEHPPIPPTVAGPLSPIRLVNLKLLTLAELDHVAAGGDAERRDLAARLAQQGDPQRSWLERPSVV